MTPIDSEAELRHDAWIDANRRKVHEATDGRVGYIYVRNTGIEGQTDLVSQFFAEMHREALIIDERWNGGGQIPTRFIEPAEPRTCVLVGDGMATIGDHPPMVTSDPNAC